MTPLARDCYRLWKYQGQITEVYSSAKATTGVNNARELSSFFPWKMATIFALQILV